MIVFCSHLEKHRKLIEVEPELVIKVTKEFHEVTIAFNDAIKQIESTM